MSVKALACIPAELMNRCKTLADLSQTRAKSSSHLSRLDSKVYLSPMNDSLRQQLTLLRQKVIHLQNKIKLKERQVDQSVRAQFKAALQHNNQLSLQIKHLKEQVAMLSHCQQQACRARVQIQKLGHCIQRLEAEKHVSNQRISETRRALQQCQLQLQAQIRLTQSLNESIGRMASKISELKQANQNSSQSNSELSRLRGLDLTQIQRLKLKIEELMQKLVSHNPQKSVFLTSENQRLQAQIKNLLSQRAHLQGNLHQEKHKQSKLPLLEHELRVRQEQKLMWRSSTNELRQQLKSKQQQVDHLVRQLSGFRDKIGQSESQKRIGLIQLNNIRRKLVFYEKRQSELQAQVQDLNQRLVHSENALKNAQQDLLRLRSDCSWLQNRTAQLQNLQAQRESEKKRLSSLQTRQKVQKKQTQVQIDFGSRSRIRQLQKKNMQLQEQAQSNGLKIREQEERLALAAYKQQQLKRQLQEFQKSQTYRTSFTVERNQGEQNFEAVKAKMQLTAEKMSHAQTRKELGIIKNNFQICLLECKNLQNRITIRETPPKGNSQSFELLRLKDELSRVAARCQQAQNELRSLHEEYKAEHGRYLKCEQSLRQVQQQHGRLLKEFQEVNQHKHRLADVQSELTKKNLVLQQTLIHNQRRSILQRQNHLNVQTGRTRSKSRNGQDCQMENLISKLKFQNRRLGDILMGQVKLRF